MPLFEARALCKVYRTGGGRETRALDGATLAVGRGEFAAVAGPSGSGKTTLLAVLGALERPTRGGAWFDGKDLGRCSDVELARLRRRMGFVFQDFALIPNLSAGDNITYPLIPRGVARAERRRRAEEWLGRFGLAGKFGVRAGSLSGGEQQRVAAARALAGRPEVVIADEPTSNLDAEACDTLRTVFRELHAEGRTLIVASHDAQVIALATRVVELEAGAVKAVREAAGG